jgi:hypothetical protein
LNLKLYIFSTIFFLLQISVAKGNNDSTIINDISVTNTLNTTVCYVDRNIGSIFVELENTGLDTISNLQLGWYFSDSQTGTSMWSSTLLPGDKRDIELTQLDFTSSGDYTVLLWAILNNGDDDQTNDSIIINVHVNSPLVVDFLKDTTICFNTPFTLTSASGFDSYSWNNGSDQNATIAADSGLYIVSVTDAFGCSAIDQMTVNYYDEISSLIPNDTVLCDGDVFVPVIPGGNVFFNWSNSDTDANGITTEGIYVYSLTDTNNCQIQDTVQVSFLSLPMPTLPTVVNICDGDTAQLSVSSNYASFLWSTGETTNSIRTVTAGVYQVTVTGFTGCIGIDSVQVMIQAIPTIDFYDTLMCNLQPQVIGVGWFETYLWSSGDFSQNPMITAPGWYYVTVTDANNCQAIDSVEVINKDVHLSLGPDIDLCQGDGDFILLGLYESYKWNNGDTTPTHWIGEGGVYSVTVTLDGCTVSDDMVVTELPYPVADFAEVVMSPDVQFTNLSNVSSGLTWDFGDGEFSNLEHPSHTFVNSGLFTVTLTAMNKCDTSIFTKSMGIFPQSAGNIYFSENLSVYPTLTSEFINFSLKDANIHEVTYDVYDAVGKLIRTSTRNYGGGDYVYQVDVSFMATGTYYLRISGDGELMGVSAFVKR